MRIATNYCVYSLFFLCACSCRQKEVWVQPIMAPITEAIFASGHIEPVDQFVLTSLNEGYLQSSHVKESDVVGRDEVLFSLGYETKAVEQQAAKENLKIAEQNASSESPVLAKLRSDLDAARQKCVRDSVQYIRLKQLHATQSVSELDVENMRLQYDMDVSNVRAIRANMMATQLSLQQALIQAKSQYDSYRTSNEYYLMKSPHTARVYQIFKKSGELVRKGEAVALLGSPDSLIVMLQVDEMSISKVKTGQVVLVELNTDKGNVYEGRLARIYPYFDNTTQSFKAEAIFTKSKPPLIAGTLLQANIIVAKKDSALLIPRACLGPDGSVTVKRTGGKEITIPHTGIVSTEWVEVVRGILSTDRVLQSF